MAKRIFQGIVLLFALYAFVFMPLGKKSALEHIRAILGTSAAREAASEVKGGVTRLVKRLESEARKSTGKGADDVDPLEEEAAAESDGEVRTVGERRGAEGPSPAPRLRTLSAEKPAAEL